MHRVGEKDRRMNELMKIAPRREATFESLVLKKGEWVGNSAHFSEKSINQTVSPLSSFKMTNDLWIDFLVRYEREAN